MFAALSGYAVAPDNKKCGRCHQNKAMELFYTDHGRSDSLSFACRDCTKKASAKSYYVRLANDVSGLAIEINVRKSHLKQKYGITPEQYIVMAENCGGLCQVCGKQETRKHTKHLAIDHDHCTGKIRGLLCHSCNAAIGLFQDNPALLRAAANYLERNAEENTA